MNVPVWLLFLIATLSGTLVASLEILWVFKHESSDAFKVRWSWFLVLSHGLLALFIFYVIYDANPQYALLPTALLVGFGLPTLIRSRFTVFMPIAEKDINGLETKPICIELDSLYQNIQGFCKDRIDRNLLRTRESQVHRLVEVHTLRQLAEIAQRTVNLREHMLKDDELQKMQRYPRKVMMSKSSDQEKAEQLAYFIVRISTKSYVEELCGRCK
jgi:hypothetical protein